MTKRLVRTVSEIEPEPFTTCENGKSIKNNKNTFIRNLFSPMSSKRLSEEKLAKELEANKRRTEALKYLESQGQSIKTELTSNDPFRSNASDNTLYLLSKESAVKQSLPTEKDTKSAILKQQSELRDKVVEKADNKLLPLPPNWQEVLDTNTGKPYYWNTATNETSWTRPQGVEPKAATVSSSSVLNLPEGWTEKIHPATNQKYYVHKSGKVSNDYPTSSTLAVDSKPKTASSTRTDIPSDILEARSAAAKNKRKWEIDPLLDPMTVNDTPNIVIAFT